MLYIQGLSQTDVDRDLGVRNDVVRKHLLSIAKKVRARLEEAD
jgi:DNA-directed RNA polymerase specialized sigma24 family protein